MSDDKDLPSFGIEVEPRLRQKLEALREGVQRLMGLRGDDDRAAVRWADVRAGKVGAGQVTNITQVIGGGGGPGDTPDLTMPPAPTGLAVTPTPGHVIVEFDAPIYTQGHGHKQTNIYATKQAGDATAELAFASAVRVDTAVGPLTVVALPSEPFTLWRVWIRFESNDGVESAPVGGAYGMTALVPHLGESIEDGGIDNSKIANLSAAKLTVGDGTVGGNLKSTNYSPLLNLGWIVRPDGYAEFNDVVARGTVYASAGAIGGALIESDHIRSTNWESLATGWRLNNNGSGQIGGIQILSNGIQSGNFVSGATGFMFSASGMFELNAPGGWIRSQMIENKAVTSIKINDAAVDTLQIAENAVILPMFSMLAPGDHYCTSAIYGASIEMLWDDGVPFTVAEMNATNITGWNWAKPYTSNPHYIAQGQMGSLTLCTTPVFQTFGQKVAISYSVDVYYTGNAGGLIGVVRCAAGQFPHKDAYSVVRFIRSRATLEWVQGDPYTGEITPVNHFVSGSDLIMSGNMLSTPQTVMFSDTPPAGEYSYHLMLSTHDPAGHCYNHPTNSYWQGTVYSLSLIHI